MPLMYKCAENTKYFMFDLIFAADAEHVEWKWGNSGSTASLYLSFSLVLPSALHWKSEDAARQNTNYI